MKTQTGGRDRTLIFLQLRRWMAVGGSLRFPAGNILTQCIGDWEGWAPESVWTGAEILALSGIRSPDRAVSSESLYRLRHPGLSIAYPKRFSRTCSDCSMTNISFGCTDEVKITFSCISTAATHLLWHKENFTFVTVKVDCRGFGTTTICNTEIVCHIAVFGLPDRGR